VALICKLGHLESNFIIAKIEHILCRNFQMSIIKYNIISRFLGPIWIQELSLWLDNTIFGVFIDDTAYHTESIKIDIFTSVFLKQPQWWGDWGLTLRGTTIFSIVELNMPLLTLLWTR
ncbi:hypothetical protein ACJX0J_039633, partial [Zea mays]